jgi:hypothetical protein
MDHGHVGGRGARLLRLQSAQLLLLSILTRVLSVAWLAAALSAPGFGGRRDMSGTWCKVVEGGYVRGG